MHASFNKIFQSYSSTSVLPCASPVPLPILLVKAQTSLERRNVRSEQKYETNDKPARCPEFVYLFGVKKVFLPLSPHVKESVHLLI